MEKLYTVSKKKKQKTGANWGSDHKLLIENFRFKLKKVGETLVFPQLDHSSMA